MLPPKPPIVCTLNGTSPAGRLGSTQTCPPKAGVLPLLRAEDHRMDVAAWLRGLGLEQYAPAFRDNDVDGEVLPELTADDLISIGVTSVGHRRKLLAAIASLGTTSPAATVMAAPRDAPAPADAERRQLTVMFCDLVGSTSLSSRL